MRRPLIIAAGLGVAVAVAFVVLWKPRGRDAAPIDVPPADQSAPAAPPSFAAPAVRPAPPSEAPAAPIAAASAEPDGGPAEPQGPFEVELGRHVIHLKDPERGRVLRVSPKLVVDKQVTAKEVRRRKEELVRMMFFLGSHRVADGAEGTDGEARFKADLIERFRNLVRTGQVQDLVFVEYEVAEAPPEN